MHAEKSFDEVKQWSDTRKQDFIPVQNLRDKLKEALSEFYNQMSRTVRTLSTMTKLQSAQSYVYNTMDKLGPVIEALTQYDDDLEAWGLKELVENLRK